MCVAEKALISSARFAQAQEIISAMPGYVSHQLQRCLESQDKYLLLVQWQKLEDHTIGFRQSPQYQDWKRLLHHFYEPFPTVEHYDGSLPVDMLPAWQRRRRRHDSDLTRFRRSIYIPTRIIDEIGADASQQCGLSRAAAPACP